MKTKRYAKKRGANNFQLVHMMGTNMSILLDAKGNKQSVNNKDILVVNVVKEAENWIESVQLKIEKFSYNFGIFANKMVRWTKGIKSVWAWRLSRR